MKKALILALMVMTTEVIARPQANWPALFGKRFQATKINMSTSDSKQKLALTFLDAFPCYRDASWGRSTFRVSEGRKAYIEIRCIYPPIFVKFAFEDKKVRTSPLGFKADAHGILECPMDKSERKSKFNYEIDLANCYEEPIADPLLENR